MYVVPQPETTNGQVNTMAGKQVTIGARHHSKLKRLSAIQDRPMGKIVEEMIENKEVQGSSGLGSAE